MAVTYVEFDTTMGLAIKDMRTQILTNTDWSYQGFTTAIATTSANAAANATALTFTSGTIPAAVVAGTMIRIDTYASNQMEYRKVTSVTATTINFSGGLVFAHGSGTSIFWGNEVFKTTTVRGADMYIDLAGDQPTLGRLAIACYGTWTAPTSTVAGIAGNGTIYKYLFWRSTVGSYTNPVHCILSSTKDHFFLSVEGPRANETGPQSATYGSQRNYFFMADLVPYSGSDTTPVVVCGGHHIDSNTASVANKNYIVNVSKSLNGLQYWVEGKLLTLMTPVLNSTQTFGSQRFTTADNEFYLAPYVVSADDCGFRGRLNNIYYAGANFADNADGVYPAVGANLTYNGITYELQAVNKSDANTGNSGPLGYTNNGSTGDFAKSAVVAIPIA